MSQAEQLDRAIDDLLVGARPHADAELRPLLAIAAVLRDALAPQPVAPRFEARLAARLLEPGTRGRLVATGAMGSAAIGLAGVTAYAVWRVAHR
jgi:hypothetical protein